MSNRKISHRSGKVVRLCALCRHAIHPNGTCPEPMSGGELCGCRPKGAASAADQS